MMEEGSILSDTLEHGLMVELAEDRDKWYLEVNSLDSVTLKYCSFADPETVLD